MLSENEIMQELQAYRAHALALKEGKSGRDLPEIPKNKDAQKNDVRTIIGYLLFPLLYILLNIAKVIGWYHFVARLSKARIEADRFSFEPKSCGLNKAYTQLGLALLAQNDLDGAIGCLDASWRVHPCPHNASYGLDRRLVSKLKSYEEAKGVVERYISVGRHFAQWPDQWAEGI